MIDGTERIETLEEVVRRLEELKADPRRIGELDFEDARVDGYVTMALTAAQSALSVARQRDGPED